MEPDGEGFSARFTRVPRILRGGDDGSKRAYPIPGNDQVWAQLFKPTELPNLGTPVKQGGLWTWDRDAFTFSVRFGASRVKFDLVLKRNVGINTLHIPFAVSGLTRQGRYLMHDGVAVAELRVPTVTDARMRAQIAAGDIDIEPIPMGWEITGGEIILSIDPTWLAQAVYPVEIDPPLDLQVGASTDDMHEKEDDGTVYDYAFVVIESSTLSAYRYWGGFRWVSDSLPSNGDTIDVCYFRPYVWGTTQDDPNINIHFEMANGPVTFTAGSGNYDITGRSRSSNSTPWVAVDVGAGYQNSPSLVTPAQEWIDAQSPSSVVLIARPNQDALKEFWARAQQYSDPAYFHIEFTPGGGPTGRIMGSLAGHGGLAGPGGLAGRRGGLAG